MREDRGFRADSNQLAVYWVWSYTSYRLGWRDNGLGVKPATLPMQVLDDAILNAIRQIVMDNNSGIH